jgi:hypothetical protein
MTSLNSLLVTPVARLPWRVQIKLLVAFLAIAALLIALGAIGLYELRAVNQRTEELIKIERRSPPIGRFSTTRRANSTASPRRCWCRTNAPWTARCAS